MSSKSAFVAYSSHIPRDEHSLNTCLPEGRSMPGCFIIDTLSFVIHVFFAYGTVEHLTD